MRINISNLTTLLASHPLVKKGCVVDTNTLFAASMPLDRLNSWAEHAFKIFRAADLPVFTNINIRSEFLDLQRRVLIPEGLATFYHLSGKELTDSALKTQLRSLRTQMDQAVGSGRLFKMNEQQVKKYRSLLQTISVPDEDRNLWDSFCMNFLHPFIMRVWDHYIGVLNIQFIGTRAIESREYFERDPNWNDMTDIIGRFGIGSADAMIVNFFLCSKFPVIITGDEDVAYAVERLSNGEKYVVVPDAEEDSLL